MLQISANQAFKDANNVVIGEPLNHITLNRNSNTLKKELNHTYNVTMASIGELCLPWVSTESYVIGELVSYNSVNYISLTNNINIIPVVGVNWIVYTPTTLASRLSTPRQINGTNFDGTANITTANWGTVRTLTLGASAKSVNGSANVAWTADEMKVVAKTSTTGSSILPVGTTAQRDASPVNGYMRYNSTTQEYEGYKNGTWQSVGGGQMLGQAVVKAISYNAQTIAENITVTAGLNAYSVGDVTIANGFTLTVENGSVYKVL